MSEQQPFFHNLSGGHAPEVGIAQHDREEAARIASQETMERDRAFGRALTARPTLPPIKEPILPDDFAAKVTELDQEIFGRGVGVDVGHIKIQKHFHSPLCR